MSFHPFSFFCQLSTVCSQYEKLIQRSEFDSAAFKTDLKLYWNGLTDFDFNKKLQHFIELIQLLT